ncbi:MAG: DnaJ C-terminal domain-containing protein, partial [Brevundimonas aurantiaca]
VPVPMTVAALGGEIDAPCLVSDACDGKCKAAVQVPAGAQTGKTVRIKGKGMPHLNGRTRGDLVVELFVETPTDLTPRQKELLQELALSFGEAQNPRNSSFAGKAKRFWADILGSQDADGSKENAA